jgi:hypothetical protein
MLGSSAVRSLIFDRITGRTKPKLAPPTSADFNAEDWKEFAFKPEEQVRRDVDLTVAALLIGPSVHLLRSKYLTRIFGPLSQSQVVTFAVADANRAWSILRTKSNVAQRDHASKSDALFTSGIGQHRLDLGPMSLSGGSDVLNTTVVDCLPHWFAVARSAGEAFYDDDFDYSNAGLKAQFALSLEHAFKEVWLQVLWEPWNLNLTSQGWRVEPAVPSDRERWAAWAWRDSDLMGQAALHRVHFDRHSNTGAKAHLIKTAVGVSGSADKLKIEIGTPSQEQTSGHAMSIVTMESSYLGAFVDDPIRPSEIELTPRRLELVVCVLKDLAHLMLPEDADVEYKTAEDIERLSCRVPYVEVATLVSQALSITLDEAKVCLECLISRPIAGLSAIFKNGLWHRPLVLSPDDVSVQFVLGALVWGNPVRRLERWLQDGVGDTSDMSGTSLGLKYEDSVRKLLSAALSKNDLLAPVSSAVSYIGPGKCAEEIDVILRIGSSVLVLEVKCFLAPTEPMERHNYLRKLEKACEQASRKANWLEQNVEEVVSRLGELPKEPKFIPLVVLNQGNGAGYACGNCVAVDARFLALYLSGGEYVSGGAVEFETGRLGYEHTRLYETAGEAEARMVETFESHPGVAKYLDAILWDISKIPLADGTELIMSIPSPDIDAFIRRGPKPADLLT